MPDQVPVQTPSPVGQTGPSISPDLSVNSGLIDNRPLQAPLPPTNTPDDGSGKGQQGQAMTLAQLFNTMKTPSDEKQYLNPEYTPQPLTKRYATWNPYIDNEEVAAKNQPWYDKWANGLVKMGATAIGTFAQSLMTIPDTMKAISSGNFSSLYQSDNENNVDTWQKNLEDEFPNYYSKWEQAHPFLSALPFSGGFSDFWADKMIKNLGFTIGAIGGAVFQDTVVGAVSAGLGELPLVGSQLGKAALWFNKIFSNETKLGEFLGATRPGLMSELRGAANAVPASQQALFDMQGLARAAASSKITDAGRFAINLYGAARTEAGFEARDGFNQVKQDLTDRFKLNNQRDPNDDEQSEIAKYATAGGNVRFGVNMALLTLSDAIQFDNVLKPFNIAQKGVTNTLQKALEIKGAEIGLKEGTVDTFERKLPQTVKGKIWNAVKPQIPNILAEGIYEEGGQYAAQVATQNYYERKYYQDKGTGQVGPDKTPWSPDSVMNVIHSTMQGLSGEFGTTEGWENIVLGSLTAILTGGVEHWYDKVKGHTDHGVETTLSLLNNNSVTGLLQNMYGNTTKSAAAFSNMQQAAKTGDLFNYKNEQSHMFTNFVLAHLQAGRFDVAMEKLNIAKDLPPEEFSKVFGTDGNTQDRQTVSSYIDALKEQANSIKNNYDAINEVFQNPYNFRKSAKNEDQILENDKHTKFEEWKASLLEHTSDINNTNRRLAEIGFGVAKVNPGITRDMISNLTHPKKLEVLRKEYNALAAEIQKSFDDKLVTKEDTKEEQKKMKGYQDQSKLITDFFTAKAEDRDQQFLKTFDNLLHFQLNGEQVDPQNPVEVSKQTLPNLIKNGVDANKLQARKTIASKAYDILTSEEGFNKYFFALQQREKESGEIADERPTPPVGVDTENMSVPITVKGNKQISFKEGQDYTLDTGQFEEQNIETLKYQGVDEKGNLQFTDSNNKLVTLSPDQIGSVEDDAKKVSDDFTKALTTLGAGQPISTDQHQDTSDGFRKDLAFAPLSTTDPRFEDNAPFNNFHKRHQTFLFNLGSTDPQHFEQSIKPTLRIFPVTQSIAESLGFPKEFAQSIEGEEPTIRGVYISAEGSKPYLLDERGKKVQELDGSPVDPNKIIFTTLPDTSLKYQGEDRYTNKSSLDPEKVQAWQKNFRDALLSKTKDTMPFYQFTVSRGIPNIINEGARNSVVEVGLISKEDLNKVVITIPTQGNVTIAALLNDQGEGIASSLSGINMPVGVPLLNHGGNLVFLNNRVLTTPEASNAFELIKELAKRVSQNKTDSAENVLDQTILKYLSRVLYFSTPQEGKVASDNQIWIDKTGIHFGNAFAIPFFTNLIEANEGRIKTFLENSYHNVNNYELSRAGKEKLADLKFNEITVKDGKLSSTNTWDTYTHYLLNSSNPPLATNIAKPVGNEIPIKQKYAVLQVKNFEAKTFEQDKKVAAPPTKAAIPGAVKKPKTNATTATKKILDIRHSQTPDDKNSITSGLGSSSLTKDGARKARLVGEDLIDEGVTNIVTSPITRAKQTAFIISTVLGVNAKNVAGLASWDIGEFDGMTDAEFEKVEKYFAQKENWDKTEFEGKKLNESFKAFVDRFLAARNEIQETAPDGTLVVTHSKNLKIWDAYNKSNKVWDQKAADLYLSNESPANTELTLASKKELKDNEKEVLFTQPDGRAVKYIEIFDNDGNLKDVRVISGVNKEGEEVQLTDKQKDTVKGILLKNNGVVAETPQITTPVAPAPAPVKEEKKGDKEIPKFKDSELITAIKRNYNSDKQYFPIDGDELEVADNIKAGAIAHYGKVVLSDIINEIKEALPGMGGKIKAWLQRGLEFLEKEQKNKVSEEKSKGSSALDKLKGHKGKPTDTQYRAANVIPGSYKVGDVAKEFEVAKRWLPDVVQFKVMKNLIHMTGGGKAWGAMRDASIYVYKNAEVGSTYHEAFELVWQNFLPAPQQLTLYTEFQGREGSFVTYAGQKKTFSEANFKEAKEQIAEEFRDYVLGNEDKLAPKQKGWFSRLVDFIKKIFLGSQADINGLFKNITDGYFKNYPFSQKNINSIEYRNIKASEAFVQDVLQGMTADLFSREFEKDSAIVTQLEENPKQAVATIYGRLFNSMQYFFTSNDPDAKDTLQAIYKDKLDSASEENEAEQENIAQEWVGIQNHWEFIKSNWNEFVDEHMQYLRVFKVEFSVDDTGEISMDSTSRRELEDYEKMTGQSEYARDTMTINARNAASEKVKLLFATIADREFINKSIGDTLATLGETAKTRIKREGSQVRMPKLASYAKTFNYVLHNVTNINGIYDIYKKLSVMSNNTRIKANAIVDAFKNRLNFKDGFKGMSMDQAKMVLAVENTLNKQKPDFVRQFVDDQGNVYFRTSIINSKVDQVVDDWITSMKGANAVKVTKDSNFIFDKEVSGIKDPVDFLNVIGIPIEKVDYQNLNATDKTKFNNEVETIKSLMNENKGKKLPIFTTKQLGIDSRLINLASIYVDKMAGDDTDSMHFNLDGELTSNFVLPNFISTLQSDANNSKTKAEFVAKNPHFNDIFHRDSILLNDILFNEDGKFVSPVNIAVIEGRESADGDNKSSYSLTEAERYIQEINHNLQGIFYTLLPADAKTEWGIYTGQYLKASEYFDEVTGDNARAKFYDRMWKNLQTEIALAKDFATNPNRQNITELHKKYDGRKKGESLRFFADILPTNRVTDINKLVIDGGGILEDAFKREDFDGLMKAWVQNKAEKSFKYLSDNKIFGISDKGNLKPNGLLTDFVGRHLGAKRQYYTQEEVTGLLAYREMNYAMNNIEMHKFFFGDPAQYSDEMKRIKSFLSGREWSHVDYVGTAEGFNQWANEGLNMAGDVQLEEGDPGYHNFSNTLSTLTLQDITSESTSLPLLQKVLGKDAKPYEGMNEADAQTWQISNSYREALLKAGGRWTQQMEDQYQWEMAYERKTKAGKNQYEYSSNELVNHDNRLLKKNADPDVYFYITKPVHSGVQSKGDTAIVSLDKTSSMPLFYRMVEGTQLENVYNAMQDNMVHYVRVESAHKVGIQTDSTIPLYKEDGSINKEGFAAPKEEIPFKYYGIQVDTSAKHESQTEGSQLRKQAVGDLMDNEVPVDYITGEHKGNIKSAKAAWDQLSDSQKEAASPIYNLVNQHEADLSALGNKRYQNLLNKLGISELEDGYDYKDVKKVSDFLLNEITRRELPNNLRDAIQPDPENTRQFKIPLEALSNYQQVRAILWSTIEKNIIRPKVNGSMKVQLSVTGWEKAHRVVKKTINGKQVLTSSELKFYSVGEDGKTQKCEIYLPFWFGKKVRSSLEKNGKDFKSDKEFRDHILNYLNGTPEGQKLLGGIGFRIPTQRDNSIESFIVKDFLPEQMGDSIVLPSEITAKAGSDFDIDKMNTYLRNFFLNKEGYPQTVPFEKIDSNDPEQLKWYYEKYMLENRRVYDQWQRERGSRDFVDKIFKAQSEDSEPEYVPTLEEYLSQARGKSEYELNSLEALENKYFDTLEKIYSLPEKLNGLVSPNDASDLKKVSNKISKLKDPNWNENKQPFGRVLDSLWMMQERHKYLVGKKGVGIAAVSQTNLNVNQNAGVYLRVPRGVAIRLPHNTVTVDSKTYVSLGSMRNQSGDFLSKVNAMYIDGYVDIAKGAWIIDMGANDNLAKNFLLMSKWGTDPYDVALFMNQPAIQMYTKEQDMRKSVSQINKDLRVLNSRQLYEYVSSQMKPGLGKQQLAKTKPSAYPRDLMENMIAKVGRGEKLSQPEAKLQMQMLSDYQEYDKLAWDMFRFYQGYNWDTSKLSDPNLVRRKLLNEEKARTGPISSIEKVLSGSFIGTVRSNTLKVDNALRALFSVQTGRAGQILDAIAKDLAERRGVKQEDYRKAMLKAELSMLDYVIQTGVSVGGKQLNKLIDNVLLSNNSAARYLKAMQESGDLTLTNNPLIQNLRANIDNREGKPSNIELKEKDNDSYTSNIWTDSLRELADNEGTIISIDNNPANDQSVAQIYRRMVLASILQSGTKRSSISWTHLIPNEHYSAIIKDAVRDIKVNMDNFYDNNVLYRTNWEDNTIVPVVIPITQDDFINGQMIARRVYPGFNSDTFNQHIKDQGIDEVPKVLRLNAFEYKDKKVVKTVEYKRDPKTRQLIERNVRLYQRVDTWNEGSTPLIAKRRELIEGDFMEKEVSYAVFREINKWGDGAKVQEYYDSQIDSQLSSNPLVNELPEDLVTYAIMNSGYSVNSDEFMLGQMMQNYENQVTVSGEGEADTESINDEATPPSTEPQKEINFKEISVEDVKRGTKKDFFHITSGEGEVAETDGYKVTISSHPDLDLYVNGEKKSWRLTDNKSGKMIGVGNSIKEAIQNGIDKINAAIKSGNNAEILKNLGVAKEIDNILKDKDAGCKK